MTLILLALDETDGSLHAAETARSLFGADATYLAVNVSDQEPTWATVPVTWGGVYTYGPQPTVAPLPQSDAMDRAQDEARVTAHHVADEAGVAAASIGETGDPVEAIVRAAEDHAADVIVVGSSEKHWWQRLVGGSVSDDVIREAACPVLVVPHHKD